MSGELRSADDRLKKEPPVETPAEAPNGDQKKELTAEEQMARYEEDLKESDWGHQPC